MIELNPVTASIDFLSYLSFLHLSFSFSFLSVIFSTFDILGITFPYILLKPAQCCDYMMDWKNGVRYPTGAENDFLPESVQTGSASYLASYIKDNAGCVPLGKMDGA